MKKLVLALSAILFSATTMFAESADLFSYNTAEFEASLNELNQLEAVVLSQEDATFESLQLTNQDLMVNISDQPMLSDGTQRKPPLGIPSWIWGCALGFIGIGIVYFVTEDNDEVMKALYGCIGYTVVVVIIYFAAFASAASSAGAI
jgi:hypothetical protein